MCGVDFLPADAFSNFFYARRVLEKPVVFDPQSLCFASRRRYLQVEMVILNVANLQ